MQQLRTVFFLGLLTGLFLLIGGVVGGASGIIGAFVFAVVINFISYFYSDKIVKWMYRAQPLSPHSEQGKRVHHLVQQSCTKMQLPKPELFIIAENSPNAFATGRDPEHASVVFTQGILQLLNDKELEGVIAHELSHVKNRDILISSIAATVAGAIGMIAYTLQFAAFSGRDGENRNPIGLLIVAISVPIIATLIQLAVSRSREFLADETAAHTLHSGEGLASALQKLEKGIHHIPFAHANQGTAHLFIANPLGGESEGINVLNWFQTHPPISERVRRLLHQKSAQH
ncbi:MAG: zinc metalloprotease HtpX [Candidatus Iainarchaeum archaeon]|uniref:Protease HtpX homolog n=1 Tax=Candidatus Iainarchaeum sp. TaxID=3101447 RepID=A0A7T9I1K2_9ARCH|nr:MAG: zinc metalloprotease HtpX [Candidatus Diapherotrites archaeon]